MSPIIEQVLQLILDQGVPADATQGFRNLGYSCWHVAELGMYKAEDEEILALAAERNAVVITLDADFHALVATRGLRRPSVIRLRREGCRAEAVVKIIGDVLASLRSELEKGCLISIREHLASVHMLPVGARQQEE